MKECSNCECLYPEHYKSCPRCNTSHSKEIRVKYKVNKVDSDKDLIDKEDFSKSEILDFMEKEY